MRGILHPVVQLGSLCAIAAVGAAGVARGAEGDVRAELARTARIGVFFGHQSVGMNVLDGLKELAEESGVALRIVDAPPGTAVPPGTVGHAWTGENHKPLSKLEAFARAVDALPGSGVDVALVKLCYVDFAPETDAAALFASYQEVLTGLRRRHPRTTFVHVTAPLSTVQGGPKALVKRLLGKAPYGVVENVRREQYNALLRGAYGAKEPLFDLARLEATGPDGDVRTVKWDGQVAPTLHPAFTDDGGHLNAAGRRRAARALVAVLAALPDPAPGR